MSERSKVQLGLSARRSAPGIAGTITEADAEYHRELNERAIREAGTMRESKRHKLLGSVVKLPGGYVGKVVSRVEHDPTILVEAEDADGSTRRVWFAEADAKPLTVAELKARKAEQAKLAAARAELEAGAENPAG